MALVFNPFTGTLDFTGSGGGSASNSFTIMQPPAGTSPTASSPTDTLTFASSDSSLTITGNSATKTLDFKLASGSPFTPGNFSTTTTGVTITGGTNATNGAVTLNIQNASGSQPGVLTAADWTTFNSKTSLPTASTKGTIAIYNGTSWVTQAPMSDEYALVYLASATNGVEDKHNRIRWGSAGNSFVFDNGVNQELTLAGSLHLSPTGGGGFAFGSTDFTGNILSCDSAGNLTLVGSSGTIIYGGQRSSTLAAQSLTTTDATVTTLYSRNASPWSHDSFTYNVEILSFDATNDVYGFWCYKVRVQTAAGTSTIITTDAIGTNTTPVGYGGITFSITSSTTFNVLVQGQAAKTVTWRAFVYQMASNGGQ